MWRSASARALAGSGGPCGRLAGGREEGTGGAWVGRARETAATLEPLFTFSSGLVLGLPGVHDDVSSSEKLLEQH